MAFAPTRAKAFRLDVDWRVPSTFPTTLQYFKEEKMSAVILAVFADHDAAERMLVTLVRDGFPTDRVNLTAGSHLGRAGLGPADSTHAKCSQYFESLLRNEDERCHPDALARRIGNGEATIVVHPRGAAETARAMQMIKQAHPLDVFECNLTQRTWEQTVAAWTAETMTKTFAMCVAAIRRRLPIPAWSASRRS
jgi:hypothetical protein